MDKSVLSRLLRLPARLFAPALLLVLTLFLCGAARTAGAAPGDRKLFPGSLKAVPEARRAATMTSTAVDASASVEFQITLRMRDFAKLQNRLSRGEHISEKEMQAKYYPLASDYAAIVAWAKSQGLTVLNNDSDHLSVRLRGTVATAERTLATKYAHVNADSKDFLAAQTVPSLPASIAGPVLGITGLQPYQKAERFSPTYPYSPPYTISDINTAYNALNLTLPNDTTTALDGAGQTIAILIDTAPLNADLDKFWSDNKVKQTSANVNVINVNNANPLPDPEGEETLDVTWSGGIASAAHINVYAAGSLYFTDLDKAIQRIIDDVRNGANISQLSISLGLSEDYISPDTVLTESQYFATLASRGVSTFVSTGDHSETAYESTDPSVTAVGGTTLLINRNTAQVASETAWSTTGGGTSQYFSRPAYQTPANATSESVTMRTVPDVASAADPNTGAYFVFTKKNADGTSTQTIGAIGGTSWSAPTWAGYCALINQARASVGLPSIGLLNPSIYPLLGTNNFRDIISGSNGVYNAGPGYDEVTGLGTPQMRRLINTLTNAATLSVTSFVPESGTPGTQVTLMGSGLDLVTSVIFNGTTTTQFQAASSTQLIVTVPAGATTGPITVIDRTGATATTATSFTVLPANAGQNDLFANAELIGPSQSTLTGSNVGATKEPGEPDHAGNPGGASIWYRWTPPADGTYTFNTFGSSFDTLLAVYTGSDVADLTEIASNDDLSTGVTSSVAFDASYGVTYYIAVDGSSQNGSPAAQGTVKLNLASTNDAPTITNFTPPSGSPGKSIEILGANFLTVNTVSFNGTPAAGFTIDSGTQITAVVPQGATTGPITVTDTQGDSATSVNYFTVVTVPGNDLFANATGISGDRATLTGTNVGAFKEPGEPDHAGNAGGSSVWFVWTAPRSGVFSFNTFNSDFDTLLAVYTGNNVAALTEVAANDDAGPLGTSAVTFNAVNGTTYHIAVDGYNGAAGNYVLNLQANSGQPAITSLTPASGGPGVSVVISGSGFLSATGVKFNGTVAPNFQVNSDSQITVIVPDGATTGPVSVTGLSGTGVSPQVFTVNARPSNDDFGAAQIITDGVPISVTGSNAGATKQAGEPNIIAGDAGGRSIWYAFTPPVSGDYTVSTQGSDFDTILGVFTGTVVTDLQLVAANDDDVEGGVTSAVTFTATRGVTYHIAVDGVNGEAGNVALSINGATTIINLYTTNFETAEGFSSKLPLVGQQGWASLTGATGGNGVAVNALPNLGQQGLVGQTPLSAGAAAQRVYHPFQYNENDSFPVVSFSTVFKITGSTNGQADQFGFTAGTGDSQGYADYFSLVFDNVTSQVYFRQGADGPLTPTGQPFGRDVVYSLQMSINFLQGTVSATLNGSPLVTDQFFDSNGDLTYISADWVPANPAAPGDNSMVFDQYAVNSPSFAPPVVTKQPGDQTVLVGQPATFTVEATGTPTLFYQWYFAGQPIYRSDAYGPTFTIASVAPSDAGRYSVEIFNAYGDVHSLDAFLVVSTSQAAATSTVTVAAQTKVITTAAGQKGVFLLTRTGDTSKALAVNYKTFSTARSGTDYLALSGSTVFKAGQATRKLRIFPADTGIHDGSTVKVAIKVLSGSGYTVGDPAKAKLLIQRQ